MPRVAHIVLSLPLLLSTTVTAQVYQWRTPPPPVSAQYAEWQFNSEPIIVNSVLYHPTRETRFFDGEIMSQVGVYRSVPVYADVTLEPHSVVYVPVGRNLMRGYERRREGELAGTQGSRVPAFPVDIPTSSAPEPAPIPAPITVPPPVPEPEPALTRELTSAPRTARSAPMHIESIPGPTRPNGVWLLYDGTRWYSDGPATVFLPNRFTQVGEYRGFPVYRENNGRRDAIWVAVVQDGPVAPYARR
jgi:hypothetical protein